jgi:hypothetical protein
LKQRISPEEYIALLNGELKRRPDCAPDMEFVPSPKGARGEVGEHSVIFFDVYHKNEINKL